MKICIIETEFHHEVIIALVNSISVKKWHITVLTNTQCYKQLKGLENCALLDFTNDGFNASRYFNENSFDQVLFVTPPVNNQFQFLYNRSALLLHNMNYWLQPSKNVFALKFWTDLPIIDFLKWIKNLPEIIFKRKKMLAGFKTLYAPSKELFDQDLQKQLSGFLDLRYPMTDASYKKDGPLRVVIPGTINKSRTYSNTIKILSTLSSQLNKEIELTLLGKNELGLSFKRFKNENFRVVDFKESVSQKQFMDTMLNADFGILPIKESKSYKGIAEYKGTTNISGAINDFYAYCLPAMVSHFYPIDQRNALLHHINDNAFENDLKDWISNERYISFKEKFQAQKNEWQERISAHNSKTLLSNT